MDETSEIKQSKVKEMLQQDIPRDAKVILEILDSMGVEDCETRVVYQLLEFMYGYVTQVLQDAQVYSNHASKTEIDLDDVRLAIQNKVNNSFTQPPPRELLLELAQNKNSQPLPLITPKFSVQLPTEEYCLLAANYQLDPQRKKVSAPPLQSQQLKRPKIDNAPSALQRSKSKEAIPVPMEVTPTPKETEQTPPATTTPTVHPAVPKILFNISGIADKTKT